MSTVTPNLGLFKYDTTNPTDLAAAFNINQALNNNWDIIDTAITHVDGLPDQTDKAGYLLTTNGTEASWEETAEVQCIVETYVNGTSWYRVYSDGWCEQGGWLSRTATGILQVTLLKSFRNTNYHVQATNQAADSYTTASTFYTPYVLSRTESSFSLTSNAAIANIGYFVWEAKGYID